MNNNINKRLLSLDVFRGLTIAGMILVNNPGSWSHIYPPLEHSEWNGCTPTDLIFPFFLFIVGVAISLSLSKRKSRGDDTNKLILQILKRSVIIFSLGLFMAAFPFFNLSSLRIPGVLQRIAVVYLISAILFLKTSAKTQTILGIFFLLIYWLLLALIPVPNVGYPNFEPTTNLGAWLDNLLMSGHLWSATKVWDPEGILSTIPAISTSIMGILTGIFLSSNRDEKEKTIGLFVAGNFSLLIGWIWNIWFPINKSIWTSSYVLFTGGWALIILAMIYWLVDVRGYKKWAFPFHVYGMNAIAVFVLSGLMAKLLYIIKFTQENGSQISIKSWLYNHIYLAIFDPINASLAFALSYVLFWFFMMWILYKKKIFIKI